MRQLSIILLLLLAPAAVADEGAPSKDVVIDFGGLRINRTQKYVEAEGIVSIQRGLIELFACAPSGKQYESVLVLRSRPYHMMTGLYLLGMKKGVGGRFQGDPTKPRGSKIVVVVSWTDKATKQLRRYRAEDLVWNHKTGGPMQRADWVFVGSRFVKNPQTGREVFMANVTGTMIVTYHDPDAILDTPLAEGADDTTFYANHHLLPPRGTKILLRLYPSAVYAKLPASQRALPLPAKLGPKKDAPPKNDAPPKKDPPPKKEAPPKKDAPPKNDGAGAPGGD